MIFSSAQRSDWRISQFNEPTFQFLDRSAWPLCAVIRDWVNNKITPFEADRDFMSKFKGKDPKQHSGSTLELLIYTGLKNGGLNINRVERQTNRTPDFVIHRQSTIEIFLECSLAASALEFDNDKRKIDATIRWIEEIEDYPYFVGVTVERISDESISKRALMRFLDQFRPPFEFQGYVFQCDYDAQGWELELSLIRKNNSDAIRTLATIRQPSKSIDNFTPLYSALSDKRPSNYGIDQNPYIICIGVDDLTANEEEFFLALYGTQYLHNLNLNRNSSGFFLHNKMPQNTLVSAALFIKNAKLLGMPALSMSLWHNPFAKFPIENTFFPCKEIKYIQNGDYWIRHELGEDKSAFDLMDMNEKLYLKYMNMEHRQAPKR